MGTGNTFDWDYLAQSVPGFVELQYLRTALGEEFPLRASRVQPPSRNPILSSLLFPLTGAVTGLTEWSVGLRSLSGAPGLTEVLADLESISETKPSHAFYLIEATGKLCRERLKVSFGPCPPSSLPRKPDAILEHTETGEKFYLEVSVQGLSAKQSSGFSLLRLLFPAAAFPDVLCAGRWLRFPTDTELHSVERKIEAGVRTARESRALVEISEGEVLEMAACHRDEQAKLDDWRANRGLSGSCFGQGPPGKTDEISRLKFKIQTEQRQLPRGYSNILLIQSNSIFSRAPVKTLISELQEPISERGHLAAVIVQGGNLGDATPLSFETTTCRFERRVEEGRFDQTLLIWNPRTEVKPSQLLIATLLRAFFGVE